MDGRELYGRAQSVTSCLNKKCHLPLCGHTIHLYHHNPRMPSRSANRWITYCWCAGDHLFIVDNGVTAVDRDPEASTARCFPGCHHRVSNRRA